MHFLKTNAFAGIMTAGKMLNDFKTKREVSLSDAIALANNLANIAAVVAVTINPGTRIGALVAFGIAAGLEAGYRAYQGFQNLNRDGQYHQYDPLVLDLDGDGIETLAAAGFSGSLFNHNNDGIRTATGWIKSDDGILVFDRNGDGIINNGSELFGNHTVLADGQNAAHGYTALAQLDSNSDGVINGLDHDFSNLKVWQDLNQDGISQVSNKQRIVSDKQNINLKASITMPFLMSDELAMVKLNQ